jgi:hypothetical protein
MTKVVEFPKSKIVREVPVSNEVIEKAKEKGLQNYADSIIDELIENLASDIENSGIDVDSKQFMKDFSFTVDGMRATIYRHFGITHGLHNFIDENVKIVNRKTGEMVDDLDIEE